MYVFVLSADSDGEERDLVGVDDCTRTGVCHVGSEVRLWNSMPICGKDCCKGQNIAKFVIHVWS